MSNSLIRVMFKLLVQENHILYTIANFNELDTYDFQLTYQRVLEPSEQFVH